jgi:hypothetical protein
MSKKKDFIRSAQSRDKHPELQSAGSGQVNKRASAADRQAPHSGKVANDRNKMGEQAPTQKNEGRRTPESRHERMEPRGGHNQMSEREGGPGAGRGGGGAR